MKKPSISAHRTTSANGPMLDHVCRQLVVQTNTCSIQRHEHGYSMARRVIDDYNFIYVTRGRVVWVVEGREVELEERSLVVVPPGVEHWAFSRSRRCTLGSLHVMPCLPGGRDVMELLRPPSQHRFTRGSRFDRCFRMFMGEFEHGSYSVAKAFWEGWARIIVVEYLRHCASLGVLAADPRDGVAWMIANELTGHIDRPHNLSDIAAMAGYSPQYVNRMFRATLGMTPLRYLEHIRMEKACVLLADDRLTVSSIADRCGFRNPFYFSRRFHALVGCSPAQYRSRVVSESAGPLSDRSWPG